MIENIKNVYVQRGSVDDGEYHPIRYIDVIIRWVESVQEGGAMAEKAVRRTVYSDSPVHVVGRWVS